MNGWTHHVREVQYNLLQCLIIMNKKLSELECGEKIMISPQQARSMVTASDWNWIKAGFECYSRKGMHFMVYAAGPGIYYARKVNPIW